MVPGFRRDHVRIPASAGMTGLRQAVWNELVEIQQVLALDLWSVFL